MVTVSPSSPADNSSWLVIRHAPRHPFTFSAPLQFEDGVWLPHTEYAMPKLTAHAAIRGKLDKLHAFSKLFRPDALPSLLKRWWQQKQLVGHQFKVQRSASEHAEAPALVVDKSGHRLGKVRLPLEEDLYKDVSYLTEHFLGARNFRKIVNGDSVRAGRRLEAFLEDIGRDGITNSPGRGDERPDAGLVADRLTRLFHLNAEVLPSLGDLKPDHFKNRSQPSLVIPARKETGIRPAGVEIKDKPAPPTLHP